MHILLLTELAIVLKFFLFLTQMSFAIMINNELTIGGSPLIKKVPFLPSLLTIGSTINGPIIWP